MEKILNELGNSASSFIINLLIALIIFVVGFRLIAWLEKSLKKEHKFSKLDPSVKSFVVSFVAIALKILLIVIALSIVGVPMASLVTIIGSCAVAIGLALQGGLSNIAGGLMILLFKPFKVGDFISVNGFEGYVKSITMFYTTITTIDNKIVQLPNGNLSNSNLVNYSANPTRRIDVDLSVSYDSNIKLVKKVVKEVIDNHELVLHEEDVIIRLKSHDASAITFTLRVWVKTEDYWDEYFNIMEDIKEAFDKNKITIPYPQVDVHLNK